MPKMRHSPDAKSWRTDIGDVGTTFEDVDEAQMQQELAGLTVNDVSGSLPAFDPNDGPPPDFGANCMIAINCVFAGNEPTKAEAQALWDDLSPVEQKLAAQIAPILCDLQQREREQAASGNVSP